MHGLSVYPIWTSAIEDNESKRAIKKLKVVWEKLSCWDSEGFRAKIGIVISLEIEESD